MISWLLWTKGYQANGKLDKGDDRIILQAWEVARWEVCTRLFSWEKLIDDSSPQLRQERCLDSSYVFSLIFVVYLVRSEEGEFWRTC